MKLKLLNYRKFIVYNLSKLLLPNVGCPGDNLMRIYSQKTIYSRLSYTRRVNNLYALFFRGKSCLEYLIFIYHFDEKTSTHKNGIDKVLLPCVYSYSVGEGSPLTCKPFYNLRIRI